MSKILSSALLLLLFTSCALKKHALTGSYPDPPISELTSKSEELVWTHLIDFISEKGLSIKLIDKSSGFLVIDDYSFAGLFSTELKDKPRNPKAFVVTSSYYNPGSRERFGPDRVVGNYNVRIKKTENGTLINVNLTNLRSYDSFATKNGSSYSEGIYDLRTTGVFERIIIDYIK